MPNISIRSGNEGHLSAVAAFDVSFPNDRVLVLSRQGPPPEHKLFFHWQTVAPGSRRTYQTDVDYLKQELDRAGLFLVAEVEGRCAGYLMSAVHSWNDTGEIHQLAVDMPCRRQGIGSALVERAVDFAHGQRLRAVTVETQTDNRVAISFYLKHGFRLCGFNDRLYSNRDDERQQIAVFLSRELP